MINIAHILFENFKVTVWTAASKDYALYTHSINVCLYGMALAHRALDISKQDALHRFGPGLLLHDIGKTKISSDILYKNGELTQEEIDHINEMLEGTNKGGVKDAPETTPQE